ncbi:DUF4397 domain-containing protein [Agromyces sp. NPDC058484]|uniref:DUF4397 domain-containing protein n=1 Tax=Agromyces sp. NPDC058484 TaxID=3346524 RepID=UPI00364BB5F4
MLAVAVACAVAPAVPAAAADDRGWTRLAHLSPDTSAVDIRVTDAGGAQVLRLDDVAYGVVSPYAALPAGRYRAVLVPAGEPSSSAPVLVADLRIDSGVAVSAIVHGLNSDIEATVITDDLTRPPADHARIRIVQASARVPAVDVSTSTGVQVASALHRGEATAYLDVPPGPWTLHLTGGGQAASVDVVVAEATASTLFVVDTADGGLAMIPVLDSAAIADEPTGGLGTGGGWLAGRTDRARTDGQVVERAAPPRPALLRLRVPW